MSNVTRLFLAALTVLLVAMSRETVAEPQRVLVPKGGASTQGVALIIDTVSVYGELKSDAAKEKLRDLMRLFEASFRPAVRRDQGRFSALCHIVLREWETEKSDPDFQVSCLSEAMWQNDDPLIYLELPDTCNEVKGIVDRWILTHKSRLERPRPRQPNTLVTKVRV